MKLIDALAMYDRDRKTISINTKYRKYCKFVGLRCGEFLLTPSLLESDEWGFTVQSNDPELREAVIGLCEALQPVQPDRQRAVQITYAKCPPRVYFDKNDYEKFSYSCDLGDWKTIKGCQYPRLEWVDTCIQMMSTQEHDALLKEAVAKAYEECACLIRKNSKQDDPMDRKIYLVEACDIAFDKAAAIREGEK